MKKFLPTLKTTIRLLLVAGTIAFPLSSLPTAHATQNAQFYLASATQTGTAGSPVVVTIMMNSGGNSVFSLKADLTYSTSYFSSASIATVPGSPFTDTPPNADSASGGNVSLTRYSTASSTYSGAVATVTLQSNGTAGSSSIAFKPVCASTADTANCSAIADGVGNELLASVSGGTISLSAPPAAASGGGAAASSSAGGTGTTTKKTTTKSASTSTTPAPTTPAATTPAAPATATPTTEVASTTGIAVVTVLNQHNKPVKDAVVTIGAVTGTTDKNGQVTLRGLTPGSTSGSIKYGDQKKAITVEVASGAQLPKAQKFTIQTKNTSALVPISAGILLLVIIGVATFLLLDHGRSARSLLQKLHKHPSPDAATDADLKFNTTTITPQPAPSASVLPAKPLPLTPAPTHTDFAPRQPIPESHPTPTVAVAPEPAAPTPPAPAAPRPLRPRNIAISREHAMEPGTIVRPSVDGFHRA